MRVLRGRRACSGSARSEENPLVNIKLSYQAARSLFRWAAHSAACFFAAAIERSFNNVPVKLLLAFTISSGGPAATISPHRTPPSGPRSMIQSAVLMTSRLCSIRSRMPDRRVHAALRGAWPTSGNADRWSARRGYRGCAPVDRLESSLASLTAEPRRDSVLACWPTLT